MDPISQAVTGAAVSQFIKKVPIRQVILCGIIGGLFPDIDIFIRSNEDPFLSLEYHRHFTHALLFVPVIAFVVSVLIYVIIYRRRVSFFSVFMPTSLGVASHGVLDSLTTYGTYLYWPVSSVRESFNFISIIDPLYTLPILLLLLLAYFMKKHSFSFMAFLWGALYLSFGAYQHYTVKEYIVKIAAERGHKAENILITPSIFNNILWRTIYRHNDTYYVDAIRHIPWQKTIHYPGGRTAVYRQNLQDTPSNKQEKDIERFEKFAQGYLYVPGEYPDDIADLRYSGLPNGLKPLWGIRLLKEDFNRHAQLHRYSVNVNDQMDILKRMLLGEKIDIP